MPARDPNWTQEEKKRRRNLLRQAETLPGGAAVAALGEAAGDLGRDIQRGYREQGLAGAAYRASGGRGRYVAPEAPAARPTFAGVRSGARQTVAPLDRSQGLTRIVQTAPGVFTDNPDAVGDVRYYDQTGMRADVATPTGVTANTSVRDYNAAERASALDLSDPANWNLVAERGRRSLARSAEMASEAQARADLTERLQRTPEEAAEIEQATIKALGENARAQLSADARIRAADIAAGGQRANAQIRAEELARDADIYERERLSNPETAGAAVRELIGSLANEPGGLAGVLANPEDPRAARVRDAVRMAAGGQVEDPQFTPAQSRRSTGLQRFLDNPITGLLGGGNQYATDDDLFTTTFDPSELGLTDEEWEAIIAADATVRNRSRR